MPLQRRSATRLPGVPLSQNSRTQFARAPLAEDYQSELVLSQRRDHERNTVGHTTGKELSTLTSHPTSRQRDRSALVLLLSFLWLIPGCQRQHPFKGGQTIASEVRARASTIATRDTAADPEEAAVGLYCKLLVWNIGNGCNIRQGMSSHSPFSCLSHQPRHHRRVELSFDFTSVSATG